jgi:hypothetical protein
VTEAVDQAETNQEAALFATAEAEEARRRVLLWQQHVLADPEIADAIGIPPTLWATLKAEGDGPPLFTIGRRIFCRVEDLRAWLDEKARNGRPGSKRLRAKVAA